MSAARRDILDAFDTFKQKMDAYHDHRDQLIKLDRDVVKFSKRLIFSLHKIATEENQDEPGATVSVVQHCHKSFAQILSLFEQMQDFIQGEDYWRLHKFFSGGLHEYLEALSFAHYLDHKTLITFPDAQDHLKSHDGTPLFPLGLQISDYLLGISDLTGELLRYAITSIGRQGLATRTTFIRVTEVCGFVRTCRSALEPMTHFVSDLKQKQEVTTNSLRKLEDVAYLISIRGVERTNMTNFGYDDPPYGTNARETGVEKGDE